MGIERIEPAVVRKDVDRRVYVLRREQIRNTGLRFRFQMLPLQRYNTFQAHWQRIWPRDRERDVQAHMARARQRFGDEASARREADRAARASLVPEPGAPVARDLAAELAELDKDFAPAVGGAGRSRRGARGGDPSPAPAQAGPSLRRPQAPSQLSAPPPSPANQPGVLRKPDALRRCHQGGCLASRPIPPPRPNAKPAAAPVPAATPARPEAKPPPAPGAWRPAAPKELPEERMRQLYAQYVDTKRRQERSRPPRSRTKPWPRASATRAPSSGKSTAKRWTSRVRVKDGRDHPGNLS